MEKVIVYLTASTFFGGPERQMLGLARELPSEFRSVFLLFHEGGRFRPFLEELGRHAIRAIPLQNDTPHLFAAVRELAEGLRGQGAGLVCCNGYKANLLGRLAARRAGIPAVAVSRGWTGESLKVRIYEQIDRINLRWMDHVVAVSEGQAAKVRRVGVPSERVSVIHNAVRGDRFEPADPAQRQRVERLFAKPRSPIVGAAGRLSPEKGFAILVEAARRLAGRHPAVGFVLFGEGPLQAALARQIDSAGLADNFVLAGFHDDLDRILPSLDLLVLPSYTEGLPNVVLEACAAGIPVVATAVGGTPEVIDDGVNGYLVPPGDAAMLAEKIEKLLASAELRQALGQQGRERVLRDFTFATQAKHYVELFGQLIR